MPWQSTHWQVHAFVAPGHQLSLGETQPGGSGCPLQGRIPAHGEPHTGVPVCGLH